MFTAEQHNILVGSILGDGGVFVGNPQKPYFYVKQKEANKKYVFWLYERFRNFCVSSPRQRKDNGQWYFSTRGLEILLPFRKAFYKERKKRVPRDIGELLVSPLSLAVWYMDDGTLDYRQKDHCAFSLTTNCFTKQEVALLSNALWKNFRIVSTVQTPLCRGIRYPKLYIGARGREGFLDLILPYIHECFAYKLPQNRVSPSETDSDPAWVGRDRRYLVRTRK